jgi:hypothetical protein
MDIVPTDVVPLRRPPLGERVWQVAMGFTWLLGFLGLILGFDWAVALGLTCTLGITGGIFGALVAPGFPEVRSPVLAGVVVLVGLLVALVGLPAALGVLTLPLLLTLGLTCPWLLRRVRRARAERRRAALDAWLPTSLPVLARMLSGLSDGELRRAWLLSTPSEDSPSSETLHLIQIRGVVLDELVSRDPHALLRCRWLRDELRGADARSRVAPR